MVLIRCWYGSLCVAEPTLFLPPPFSIVRTEWSWISGSFPRSSSCDCACYHSAFDSNSTAIAIVKTSWSVTKWQALPRFIESQVGTVVIFLSCVKNRRHRDLKPPAPVLQWWRWICTPDHLVPDASALHLGAFGLYSLNCTDFNLRSRLLPSNLSQIQVRFPCLLVEMNIVLLGFCLLSFPRTRGDGSHVTIQGFNSKGQSSCMTG